jgi:uncharacterized protein (TIGR02145 family)
MKKTSPYFLLLCVLLVFAATNSCKKDPVIPTLTTNTITGITINSAVSGGVISSSGGADVTAKGICYGTASGPTVSGTRTTDGTGPGSFTSNMSDLTPNTVYYVRAYATNKAGTGYGKEVSFTTTAIVVPALTTTVVTSIGLTTAVTGGNITSDGGGAVTAKGVCWATTTNPTISNSLTSDGTGTGSFVSNLTGLLPSTTYFLRAYATNSAGTAYGNEVTFTTTAIVVPTLTTAAVSAVTLTTAVSGGNISSDGGAAITAKGTCWATTANPTITNSKTSDGTGSGNFVSSLSGLLPGVTYHIRAYATNSAGTAYGNDLSFTTTAVVVPTLTTTAVTAVTLTTAVSGGNITADGGGSVTGRGVCWATTADPTTANSKTSDATGTGSFISNLTGLLPGTTYHVRAYATNSAGTAYGADISFVTNPVVVPTLTTTAVTGITLTSGVSGGNITANGGGTVSVSGICWATTTGPTVSGSKTTDGTLTGSFTSNLTGLSPSTTYYVRSYATNSAGTGYGNEVSFTTGVIVIPTLTTTTATSIGQTTAISGGNISANGGGAVTVRGVCWSTTASPTTSNFVTSDGTGSGAFVSSLASLTPGTLYHIRAYATNSAGTAYGNELTFTTNPVLAPTVTTTTAISAVTLTTAASGGTITSDGGGSITVKGVCWATTTSPQVAVGNFTSDGTGTATFTSNITGLLPGTLYYVRAYATNSAGTSYGTQVSLTTRLADDDGNTYSTVLIGSQLWMAENLKTTKYYGGAAIPNVTDNTAWTLLTTPGYAWYDNTVAYKALYGAMYNWFAVDGGNLCPTGWHVPTDADFNALEVTLGLAPADVNIYGYRGTTQGTQLKNTTGWAVGENGTNTSGWSALPGGYRYWSDGTFQAAGSWSYWWSSTALDGVSSWYRRIDGTPQVYKGAVENAAGKYVRCIKN